MHGESKTADAGGRGGMTIDETIARLTELRESLGGDAQVELIKWSKSFHRGRGAKGQPLGVVEIGFFLDKAYLEHPRLLMVSVVRE